MCLSGQIRLPVFATMWHLILDSTKQNKVLWKYVTKLGQWSVLMSNTGLRKTAILTVLNLCCVHSRLKNAPEINSFFLVRLTDCFGGFSTPDQTCKHDNRHHIRNHL